MPSLRAHEQGSQSMEALQQAAVAKADGEDDSIPAL